MEMSNAEKKAGAIVKDHMTLLSHLMYTYLQDHS